MDLKFLNFLIPIDGAHSKQKKGRITKPRLRRPAHDAPARKKTTRPEEIHLGEDVITLKRIDNIKGDKEHHASAIAAIRRESSDCIKAWIAHPAFNPNYRDPETGKYPLMFLVDRLSRDARRETKAALRDEEALELMQILFADVRAITYSDEDTYAGCYREVTWDVSTKVSLVERVLRTINDQVTNIAFPKIDNEGRDILDYELCLAELKSYGKTERYLSAKRVAASTKAYQNTKKAKAS